METLNIEELWIDSSEPESPEQETPEQEAQTDPDPDLSLDTADSAEPDLAQLGTAILAWQQALSQPETQRQAILDMLNEIQAVTGINPAEVWQNSGSKPTGPDRELAELKAWKAQVESERQEQSWMKQNGPRLVSAIKQATGGWEVTPEMILEARREFPKIKDGLTLMKRAFPDAWAAHVSARKPGDAPGSIQLTRNQPNQGVDLSQVDPTNLFSTFRQISGENL